MNRGQYQHQFERLLSRINALATSLYQEDAIVIESLTNFGFIRLSGYIEKCHKVLFANYAQGASSLANARYIEKSLQRVQNLNAYKCGELVSGFCPTQGALVREHSEMAEGGRWKVALDGVYNVRNSQAHGGAQTMNLANLNQYTKSVNEYFDFLELCIARL